MKRLLLLAWMGVALMSSAAAINYEEKEPLARILGFNSYQRKFKPEPIAFLGAGWFLAPMAFMGADAQSLTLAYIGNTKKFGTEDIRRILQNHYRDVKRIDRLSLLEEDEYYSDAAPDLGLFDFMLDSIERYILLKYREQLEYGDTFVAYIEGFLSEGMGDNADPYSCMLCWCIRYEPLLDLDSETTDEDVIRYLERLSNLRSKLGYYINISELDPKSRAYCNIYFYTKALSCFDSNVIRVDVTYN